MCITTNARYSLAEASEKDKDEAQPHLEDFNIYCVRRDIIRYLPGLRKLAEEKFPSTPFGQVGVDINYGIVPPAFGVFLLETLTHDSNSDVADQASRLHRRAQQGKDNSILVRVTRSKREGPKFFRDAFTITQVEVLISNADDFKASKDFPGEKVPRMVCQDDQSRELESVGYDRIDEFLSSLVPEGTTLTDDKALTQFTQDLRVLVPKTNRPRA